MEDRPKILPPTLRMKERYIVFEIISEKPIEYSELTRAVWFSASTFLGELKLSEIGLKFIKDLYNPETQQGVIRCTHDAVEYVRGALIMIKNIGDLNAIVRVMGVTGTIDAAKRKYLGFKTLESFEGEKDGL
ncbi:MAG: ribonuclease P protein component 2 [Candidatus Aenigmarchaeota archaeon]|nr:ribonuclease P protein component 2 [Candidatus Aenigmarchaeota archaeon]